MAADTLLGKAHELLAANTQRARLDGREYVFSVPSTTAYPFQWFWDSCFHAIVWARIDAERAKEELRGLLAVQTADGLLPHVIFWNRSRVSRRSFHYLESKARFDVFVPGRAPFTSAQMQPPVIAQAVEAIADVDGPTFAAEALPALERYYRYLAHDRDPDRDGLISIIAQFESGLDFSPAYDSPRTAGKRGSPLAVALHARAPQVLNVLLDYDLDRVFRLNRHQFEDVLVNSIYIDGLHTVARLAEQNDAAALAGWATAQAQQALAALIDRCYDERRGLFFNLAGPDERRNDRVKTIISLLPLLIEDLPREIAERLVEHLTDPKTFWPEYPVPSVALDEPSFVPDSRLNGHRLIWRGPCSLNTNWLLVRGLRKHGYDDVADSIAERSRSLVERGGFNEFFDPVSGRPVGAAQFGWATLAAAL